MATVLDMMDNLQALDIQKEALVSISKTQQSIIELNHLQLSQGKRSNDTILPDYSPVSVKVYGKRPGPFTLYDTGRFYRSFKTDIDSTHFTIVVDDLHDLLKNPKIGSEILGLDPANQKHYNQDIFLPEFAQSIEKQTGLKVN